MHFPIRNYMKKQIKQNGSPSDGLTLGEGDGMIACQLGHPTHTFFILNHVKAEWLMLYQNESTTCILKRKRISRPPLEKRSCYVSQADLLGLKCASFLSLLSSWDYSPISLYLTQKYLNN